MTDKNPMSETMAEAAARHGFPFDHVEYECDGRHDRHCMFCDGGLFACTVCGSFEGATTTQCPGRKMTADQRDRVYAGDIDYRGGQWITGVLSFYAPGGYKQALS